MRTPFKHGSVGGRDADRSDSCVFQQTWKMWIVWVWNWLVFVFSEISTWCVVSVLYPKPKCEEEWTIWTADCCASRTATANTGSRVIFIRWRSFRRVACINSEISFAFPRRSQHRLANKLRMKLSPYPEQTHPTPSSHHTPAPGAEHNPPRPGCFIQFPPLLEATTMCPCYTITKRAKEQTSITIQPTVSPISCFFSSRISKKCSPRFRWLILIWELTDSSQTLPHLPCIGHSLWHILMLSSQWVGMDGLAAPFPNQESTPLRAKRRSPRVGWCLGRQRHTRKIHLDFESRWHHTQSSDPYSVNFTKLVPLLSCCLSQYWRGQIPQEGSWSTRRSPPNSLISAGDWNTKNGITSNWLLPKVRHFSISCLYSTHKALTGNELGIFVKE